MYGESDQMLVSGQNFLTLSSHNCWATGMLYSSLNQDTGIKRNEKEKEKSVDPHSWFPTGLNMEVKRSEKRRNDVPLESDSQTPNIHTHLLMSCISLYPPLPKKIGGKESLQEESAYCTFPEETLGVNQCILGKKKIFFFFFYLVELGIFYRTEADQFF